MLLLTLITWANDFQSEVLTVLGDNVGALQNALDLKGRGTMAAVAREFA